MSAPASTMDPTGAWFEVRNAADIPSPALLVHPGRIDANLREMLRIAGGPMRLRPHIKTHKAAELVRRQMALGIAKFKCATLAEAARARDRAVAEVRVNGIRPGGGGSWAARQRRNRKPAHRRIERGEGP